MPQASVQMPRLGRRFVTGAGMESDTFFPFKSLKNICRSDNQASVAGAKHRKGGESAISALIPPGQSEPLWELLPLGSRGLTHVDERTVHLSHNKNCWRKANASFSLRRTICVSTSDNQWPEMSKKPRSAFPSMSCLSEQHQKAESVKQEESRVCL